MEVVAVASPKERAVKVLDLATGTVYFTFRDTAPPTRGHGMATLGGAGAAEGVGGAGDYLLTSQANEHAIVFHRWGKTQPVFKCKTPEQVGPVAATPDGLYLLAGGKSGRVYAWEAASGSLLRAWDAHFKAVTCLALSSDGGVLVTGSEDTLVKAWVMGEVVAAAGIGAATPEDPAAGGSSLQPLRSWAEHSLPVTGLMVGQGGPMGRVASCSLDHTVRIYELGGSGGSGHSVCSVRCPSGLTSLAWAGGEKALALGGAMGDVYLVDMDVVAAARSAARATIVQATAGAVGRGLAGGEDGEGGSSSRRLRALVGHGKAVASLGFSMDGRLVVSASEDGSVRVWDSDSLQCVCKVTTDTPGPCGPLLLLPRPSALLEMLPKATPPAPLQPLKKYRTAIVPSGSGGGAGGGGNNHAALVAMAAQVEGDLVFVRGGGGSVEGPPKQEGTGSGLFWRGGYSTACTPARALPEPAAAETDAVSAKEEERGGQEGHNKRRRDEEGELAEEEEEEEEAAAPAAAVPPKTAVKVKGKGKGGGGGNGAAKNTKQKRSK